MIHRVVPVKVYVTVFCALLALTVTTVAVARFDLGEFNFVAAMTIAVIKGTLVAMFFMDLRRAASLTRLIACAGLFWLAILLVLVMSDYGSRNWPRGPSWL
jgi:cytochrome c oxidase subunit 4